MRVLLERCAICRRSIDAASPDDDARAGRIDDKVGRIARDESTRADEAQRAELLKHLDVAQILDRIDLRHVFFQQNVVLMSAALRRGGAAAKRNYRIAATTATRH